MKSSFCYKFLHTSPVEIWKRHTLDSVLCYYSNMESSQSWSWSRLFCRKRWFDFQIWKVHNLEVEVFSFVVNADFYNPIFGANVFGNIEVRRLRRCTSQYFPVLIPMVRIADVLVEVKLSLLTHKHIIYLLLYVYKKSWINVNRNLRKANFSMNQYNISNFSCSPAKITVKGLNPGEWVMMASAQVVETSVNTNNSPSQDTLQTRTITQTTTKITLSIFIKVICVYFSSCLHQRIYKRKMIN